jgi:hypothetical protein
MKRERAQGHFAGWLQKEKRQIAYYASTIYRKGHYHHKDTIFF